MSLEAHHRFILDTMQRNQDIARNIINELEAENARLKADVVELADAIKLASEVGIKVADEVTRLKAENERLRKLFADTERLMLLDGEYEAAKVGTYARLKAENARLRKAGDGLHKSMLECGPNEMAEEFDHDRWWASYYGWQAAKETPPNA